MSAFPETSVTLLAKLAAQVTGEDEANWVRFADLYVPAIRDFARRHGDGRDAATMASVCNWLRTAATMSWRGRRARGFRRRP